MIMSSANRVLFLPSQYFYLLFPYLMALARTSRMILKRSGKSGYSCLVPDLSRKVVCFIYQLRKVPSVFSLLRAFVVNEFEFCKMLFCQLILSCDFSLASWCDGLGNWFSSVEPILHTWNKAHLVIGHKFFLHWFDLLILCWGVLHLCSWRGTNL